MGEKRWSASLHSWWSTAIFGFLVLSNALFLLDEWDPWRAAISTTLLGIFVFASLRRLVVGDDGIAVRPGLIKLPWREIHSFAVEQSIGSAIRVLRPDGRRRPILATQISRERADILVERLHAELAERG